MNEYGELTAIYNIPQEWGGILDLDSYANVFEIFIEDEENLTVSFEGLEGDQLTEWGDLSISRGITHTYPAPGRYIVKTNLINPLGLGKGTSIDSTLASLVTKIYKLTDTEFTSASYLFKGFSNLKELCKLTLNLPNPTHMFENCVKIPDIDVSGCIFTGTDFSYMFFNCTIPTIKFTIPDTAKNIDYIFGGCNNLIDISDMVFGRGITSATNWSPPNLKYANNVIDKSSFKLFKGNTTIQYVKNISRPNSTNWDNYFEGCISLKEDIIFPNNTTSVISCYKNCEKLTHVHSNWNNTYNSSIITTDCYSGCNGITHIDGENVIAYEGANGLDGIPTAWGGNGFLRDRTGIYVIEVPTDSTTITLGSVYKEQKVNWGDGTITTGEISHTYEKAGVYTITGMATVNHSYSLTQGLLRTCLKKVLQIPTNCGSTILQNCTSLEYANLTDGSVGTAIFYGCTSLTYANVTNIKFQFNRLDGYFYNCSNLETIVGLDTWNLSRQSGGWSKLFCGCKKLKDLSGVENWTIATADISSMFEECSSVTSLNLGNWDISKVTNLSSFVSNCSQLNSFYAPKNINVSLSNFTASTLLTSEHLMSIINNLNTVSSTQTLTIGATNLAKLTSNEIKIATDKGWTIV